MNSKQRRAFKRRQFRELKERIERDDYQQQFSTHQYIDNSGFVDLTFFGQHKGKPCIWNACFTTAVSDYYEKIDNMFQDDVWKEYPCDKFDNGGLKDFFKPYDYDKKGKPTSYVMEFPEDVRKCLDNRSRILSERVMAYIDSKPDFEFYDYNVEIDESYRYGIGLHIRVGKPGLNVEDVTWVMNQFLEHGPTCFDGIKKRYNPNSEEMGIELKDGSNYITWTAGRPDIVSINTESI